MSILDSARLLTEEGDPNALASGAAMEVEEDDDIDWVNDVYRQLNGAPNLNQSTWWQRLNKYRALVGLFSGVLSLFGAGVLVWFSSCFPAFSSFGETCTTSGVLALAAGILILATGILGCVASCCCKCSSLLMFLAALFFSYAVLCGTLVTYMTYARLHDLNGLQAVWAKLVAAKPGVVCDIENKLECSGFKKDQCCRGAALNEALLRGAVMEPTACYLEAANGTTFDIDTRKEVEWPHTMCASRCSAENAKYGQTCETVLTSLLRSRFYYLIFLPSSCTVFFLILSGITVASLRWKPRVDNRMLHRF